MNGLVDLLSARSGLVCAVGAGGKKTTLYHLATHHPGRVGLTCTVPHGFFPESLPGQVVVAEQQAITAAVLDAARSNRLVSFALPPVKKARYGGVDPSVIEEIRRREIFDVLLVKGDGARMRWIKAPNDDEPLIPKGTTTVIALVSARALGAPLTEGTAHRPLHVAALTGARPGEPITAAHVARLLASDDGALKGTTGATVVPVINMVDDAKRRAEATGAARHALQLTDRFDRVILTSHRRDDPLVDVVSR